MCAEARLRVQWRASVCRRVHVVRLVHRVVRRVVLRARLTFLQYFSYNSFVTTPIDFILVALER